MEEIISLDSVVNVLSSTIPDAEWLLGQIESENGWLRFPPFVTNVIKNLKLESYPLLYSSEKAIALIFLKSFLTDEEIRDFDAELVAASPTERGELLTFCASVMTEVLDKIEIPRTPAEREAAKRQFDALPVEEQKELIRFSQYFFSFFLATFYQNLSVMVHGEKLTALVARAQVGDDDAFVKAVQVDRRILMAIPYFTDRYSRAQDEADSNFYDLLSYRLSVAPYRGKIRHKSLWLTFSMLQQTGWLDRLKHREILDVCDEAGVGGYKNRIQSVKHLSSRLNEFREFQKRGIVINH